MHLKDYKIVYQGSEKGGTSKEFPPLTFRTEKESEGGNKKPDMRAKPKQPLVITKVKYAPADNVSRQKIRRVLELLLRQPTRPKEQEDAKR